MVKTAILIRNFLLVRPSLSHCINHLLEEHSWVIDHSAEIVLLFKSRSNIHPWKMSSIPSSSQNVLSSKWSSVWYTDLSGSFYVTEVQIEIHPFNISESRGLQTPSFCGVDVLEIFNINNKSFRGISSNSSIIFILRRGLVLCSCFNFIPETKTALSSCLWLLKSSLSLQGLTLVITLMVGRELSHILWFSKYVEQRNSRSPRAVLWRQNHAESVAEWTWETLGHWPSSSPKVSHTLGFGFLSFMDSS